MSTPALLDRVGWGPVDTIPSFDPSSGKTLIEPPGDGTGYWAGAPSACFAPHTGTYYLYYRLRSPRSIGRGGECRIARSDDGLNFEDAWSLTKDVLGTESIERGYLVPLDGGGFRLYLSFVCPKTRKWRIDVFEADTVEGLVHDGTRATVLSPGDVDGEAVKDPFVCRVGSWFYMFVSFVPRIESANEDPHDEGDVFRKGGISAQTGLAISRDGIRFEWLGSVVEPTEPWNAHNARGTAILHRPPHFWMFWDGASSADQNYEECGALAWSRDLLTWKKVDIDGPRYRSPYGCVRYVEALEGPDRTFYYYEWTREDGSHEMRVATEEREA